MPSIHTSIPVDTGISVFCYSKEREGWFVRKWNKSERRYRIKRIEGATTQEEALATFYKALVTFEQTPQRNNKKHIDGATLVELVEEFRIFEEQRVSAGLKDHNASIRRVQSMKKMIEYFEAKEIVYPSQIDGMTFEDYPVFRKSAMKGTRKTELKDIGAFCRNFLVPRGYLTNEIAMGKHFLPRVRINDEDLDANPAITLEDYKVINTYLRGEFIANAVTYRGEYTRRMFYCFIHILKNSGCRPSELLAVRRKDIEITNPQRFSDSKQKWEDDFKLKLHIRKSKTGKRRDVLCRSNAASNLLEFLKFQKEWMANRGFTFTPKGDSLIFGKPDEHFEKTISYRHIDSYWAQVRSALKDKLEGNRFSDREYTIYSLRSTFIENCITDNLDVYLVARLCGNSVDVIQKYYDRHDVLKRAQEVQKLPIGKTKPPKPQTVDLDAL